MGQGRGTQSVDHIVLPGNTQLDHPQVLPAKNQLETTSPGPTLDVLGPVIVPGAQAVGEVFPIQIRQHRPHPRIVPPQQAMAVKGQAPQILTKGLLYLPQIPIGVQVFGVDRRHQGRARIQPQKAAVEFIGLNHKEFPWSKFGLYPALHVTADQDRRAQPSLLKNARHHGSRGRLAVTAGHADGEIGTGQLPQQLGPADDRYSPLPGFDQLFVAGRHGGGVDHQVGVPHLICPVPDTSVDPFPAQLLHNPGRGPVRAGDAATEGGQDPGQPFHAHPTDTHQMDPAKFSE